jgi:hypothetical protein
MQQNVPIRLWSACLVVPIAALTGCEHPAESKYQAEEIVFQVGPSAPVVNENLIHIVAGPGNWVVDAGGNGVTDPDALLWSRDPFIPVDPQTNPIEPLLAPDGHQVTLREYTAVEGRLRVKCTNKGTHVSAHFSDLFPKGVYTLWLALWSEPIGTDPSNIFRGLFAVGAAGPQDGSENAFRASASGEGQVSLTITEGPLDFVPGQVEDACLFDDPNVAQWHIVGAYHLDGQTHGGDPGPRVEPFLFIFDN